MSHSLPDWSRPPDASGSEHHVWYHEGRVWKLAYAPKTVELEESPVAFGPPSGPRLAFARDQSFASYQSRCEQTNWLFRVSDIRIEGKLDGLPLMSMALVVGVPPTLEEIEDTMLSLGFVGAGTHLKAYAHPELGVIAADCHEKNFVKIKTTVVPIDLVLRYDPQLVSRLGLTRLPTCDDDDDEL